jgi:DNA-binding FadR family transcriptional regulator
MARGVVTVTEQIMRRIVEGVYVGKLPPQESLVKELNVSRTLLREAISRLEYVNVVTCKSKTGTDINPSDQWRVFNDDVSIWAVQIAQRSLSSQGYQS